MAIAFFWFRRTLHGILIAVLHFSLFSHSPIQAGEASLPLVEKEEFPLWDGRETAEAYAARARLNPTDSLDLGNGVTLELCLVPAGTYLMGTLEPEKIPMPSEKVWLAQLILVLGIALVIMVGIPILREAVRKRQRPQFSILRMVAGSFACGVALLGAVRWEQAKKAWKEYRTALAKLQIDSDEVPQHEVTLSRPFYLGKLEVTQAQFQQVMGSNPSKYKGVNHPADSVSYNAALAFCEKVYRLTGREARLPREAEWEFACRAGTKTRYHSGEKVEDLDAVAWYRANAGGTTHPVGQKAPNAFGLYDMHGNVQEWCLDWYDEQFYRNSESIDPTGPITGERRVMRGGLLDDPEDCRSTHRFRNPPNHGCSNDGFRVVVNVTRSK